MRIDITTTRLRVATPVAGDEHAIHAALCASLPLLRQFPASLPWAVAEPSVEASASFVRHAIASTAADTDFPLLFCDRVTGDLVGCGGIHQPDFGIGRFRIGFWGNVAYKGNGLMLEAVGAVIAFCFEELKARRVEAWVDQENPAALKLCERAGMQAEGVLRNERMNPDGTMRNTVVLSRVR